MVSLEIPLETAIRGSTSLPGFEAKMRTILNPAPAPAFSEARVRKLLAAAGTITPNRSEAAHALSGMNEEPGTEPDWPACGVRLKAMGPEAVLITLGSRGCQVIGARTSFVAAPRVEAVDTVGAGDAFNGALAAALADGRDLDEAAAWATAAAALAVTQRGAQSALPVREAIEQVAARTGAR